MNREDLYRELEKGFVSTFIGELIPGVLHNFANPLNGIMGRAKLLQRRLKDSLRKMEERYPGFAQAFGEDKVIRDIDTISSESERFFDIFRDLAGKFSALAVREPEQINLSKMVEAEVRFADFYLDFKHEIKKNMELDVNLPEIRGDAADYSLCISTLLLSARSRLKNCPLKEVLITTSHDASHVTMMIQDGGRAISPECEAMLNRADTAVDFSCVPDNDRQLCYALILMKHYGARIQMRGENGWNTLSLIIPYI